MAHVKISNDLGCLSTGDPIENSVRYLNDSNLMTHSGTDRGNLQSDIASADHKDAARINQRLAEHLGVVDRPKSEQTCQIFCGIVRERSRPRPGRHDQFGIAEPATAGKLDLLPGPVDAYHALSRVDQYARFFEEFLRAKAEAIDVHLADQKCLGERRPLVRQPSLLAHDGYFALMPRLAQTDSARERGLASSYNDDIVAHLDPIHTLPFAMSVALAN
jgi:hypothetical protein